MTDIQKTFTLYQVANRLNSKKYLSPNIVIVYLIGRCFVNIRLAIHLNFFEAIIYDSLLVKNSSVQFRSDHVWLYHHF